PSPARARRSSSGPRNGTRKLRPPSFVLALVTAPRSSGSRSHPQARARGKTMVEGLRCRVCESAYPAFASGICVRCFGPLEPVYDWDTVGKTATRERIEDGPRSIWRYEALLPSAPPPDDGRGPGWTPLVEAPRLARALGVGELYL